jgi:hypothetical protein
MRAFFLVEIHGLVAEQGGKLTVAQYPIQDLYRTILAHPATPLAAEQMAYPFFWY